MKNPSSDSNCFSLYGPVPSRRLGFSLGVDILPFKTCTFNCIYCQLGASSEKKIRRKTFFSTESVLPQIKKALSSEQRKIIQEDIFKMGGVLTDILSNFEAYRTIGDEFEWIFGLPKGISIPKEPWFFADLWRIEFIKPKPIIPP